MNPDTERAAERAAEARACLTLATDLERATPERWPVVTIPAPERLRLATALRCWAAVLAPTFDVVDVVAQAMYGVRRGRPYSDLEWESRRVGEHTRCTHRIDASAAIAALRECAATPADAAATERGA